MKVLLFGATGMIGKGVLRECLLDSGVERVLAVGRSPSGATHAKLRDLVLADLTTLSSAASELEGFDACFFSLGVTAVGLDEAQYTRVTYDLTLAVANVLARVTPSLTFIYVSGQGTDSSEHGRTMWARVKGRTENALLRIPAPFKTFMFRPGAIIPLHGIKSRTGWYNLMYSVMKPLYPVLQRLAPNSITTTAHMGRAMIAVARKGYSKRVLETPDINRIGSRT